MCVCKCVCMHECQLLLAMCYREFYNMWCKRCLHKKEIEHSFLASLLNIFHQRNACLQNMNRATRSEQPKKIFFFSSADRMLLLGTFFIVFNLLLPYKTASSHLSYRRCTWNSTYSFTSCLLFFFVTKHLLHYHAQQSKFHCPTASKNLMHVTWDIKKISRIGLNSQCCAVFTWKRF